LQLARVCLAKRLSATAAYLCAEAFAANAALADDPSQGRRYLAARAAALAGCGRSEDAPPSEAERARLRQQALSWLRADLALWAWYAVSDRRPAAENTLRDWQRDRDLACVRDAAALAVLPTDERAAWQTLWADVDALLRRLGEAK
jgi:hypothetical protein